MQQVTAIWLQKAPISKGWTPVLSPGPCVSVTVLYLNVTVCAAATNWIVTFQLSNTVIILLVGSLYGN